MKHPHEFLDKILDEMDFEKNDINRAAYFKTMSIMKNVDEEISESGVLPDTYGVDSLFLSFFVNEDMMDDLPWIIIDFYRHEAEAIPNISKVNYLDKHYDEIGAYTKICDEGINLIFNAFRDGNEYAKLTLQNLYKTYYSSEYRSFKRYNIIDINGIDALADGDGAGQFDEIIAARILTMCQIFDKKIDRTALYQFPIIAMRAKSFYEFVNEKAERPKLEELCEEDKEKFQSFLSYLKTKEAKNVKDTVRLLAKNTLLREGYFEAWPNDDEIDLYYVHLFSVLRLLRFGKSKEDFSPRELLILATLVENITDLSDDISDRDWFIEILLGGVQPQNIKYPLAKVGLKGKQKPVISKPASVNTEIEGILQEYMNEINNLRRELKRSEQETAHYRQMLESERAALKEEKEVVEALKQNQEELVTLRNFAWQQTEQDLPESEKLNTEAMCDRIRDKRILVIGGHPNWVYKFRNMFPSWRFIDPSPSGSIDSKIMDNTDCALFFTDIITHSVYNKYIAIAREKKVPFGYLHATNVDASIREMFYAIEG